MSKLSKRAISTLVIAILLISTIASILPMAAADDLGVVTVTADTFAAEESTDYTISFTTVGDILANTGTITITFPVGYVLSLIDTDVGMDDDGIAYTTGIITIVDGTVTITAGPAPIAGGSDVVVVTSNMQVKNPAILADYTINVATSAPDTGSCLVTIVPGDAATLTVEGIKDPFESGTDSGVTVTAFDLYDNIATGYTGTITFDAPEDTSGAMVLPTDYTFTGAELGVIVFDGVSVGEIVTLVTVGEQSVTATDDVDVSITGSQTEISVYIPGTSDFSIDHVEPLGTVVYDDVLTVYGSGVTSGSAVNLYWDFVTAGSLLNSTTGLPDGDFESEVTVPSAVYGNHYIWAKDLASGISTRSDAIFVMPKITLSSSSGLKGDDITIKGYGFSDDSDIDITFSGPGDPLSNDAGLDVDDETNDLGYFDYTFEVDTIEDGDYTVIATDADGHSDTADFKVGVAISLDPDEGPSGTVVTISGRGWDSTDVIFLAMDSMPLTLVGETPITVSSTGKFTAKVVIPSMADEKKYEITATAGSDTATAKFDVTGNSAIKLNPGFAPPGGSVEIKGYNFTQISGTEITLALDEIDGTGYEVIDTIETDSNGEFSETIRVPAVDYGTWELWAEDLVYGLDAEKDFRIGIMIVIISPSYGPTGTSVHITGIGFSSDGSWNATMDGVALTDESVHIDEDTEAISAKIYIPTVPADTYTITVLDIDTEIEVTGTFVVTGVTELSMDPASAPNEYNVTVKGLNFADDPDISLDFVLYNATEEWDMDVKQTEAGDTAVTGEDGEFTAWWLVPDDEILSLGTYTVNVTDGEGLVAQTSFSIVKERIYIKPLKDKFDIGNTVSFDIKNDFYYHESFMEIRDPDSSLYWRTKGFDKDVDWLKDAGLYTVPFYAQVSGGNPMTLSSDAPLGEWFWAFYTDPDTQLVNGTFVVGPSLEAALTEQMKALSEELGMDIDTLRTYIDDLGIDMDESVASMAEQIATAVSSMEDDISGLSEDLDDAVTGMQDDISGMGNQMTSLEALVDDISTTSTDAQGAANDAKAAADKSLEAAETTQRQTSGLQGLVYGAIGASLIAALAAIVSLMQISRRIAG